MSRPKGYAQWNPKDETRILIHQIKDVLSEYSAQLPLTARQIFYRLVGAHDYPKDERAYARLCEALVRARRAQMIDFEDIRDDGTVERIPLTFSGPEAFWDRTRRSLKNYNRDRLADQDVRVELWCEAAGMVPQLQKVAFPYSVPVYSTGGFSSVTVTYEIARRAMAAMVPTVFLHVGDYDPSGESIFEAMTVDAGMFIAQEHMTNAEREEGADVEEMQAIGQRVFRGEIEGPCLRPRRVALTEDQVYEHDLPTAPPKRTDTRSRNWVGETCQCEAMPPDLLARTIEEAIQDVIDYDRYKAMADREAADREEIEEAMPA